MLKLANITDGVQLKFRKRQDEDAGRERRPQMIGIGFEKGKRWFLKELFIGFRS